mmetsp:Transcript_47417/g.93521  ORF Transcript_47417/g.93521 Transcript_47417/m.93521 type:complete len:120 (-) Transcript_47417:380-739(-)
MRHPSTSSLHLQPKNLVEDQAKANEQRKKERKKGTKEGRRQQRIIQRSVTVDQHNKRSNHTRGVLPRARWGKTKTKKKEKLIDTDKKQTEHDFMQAHSLTQSNQGGRKEGRKKANQSDG